MEFNRRRLGWAGAAFFAAPASGRAAGERPFTLERSAVLDLDAGGARYRLMVAWPEGPPPSAGWPVLYVLGLTSRFVRQSTLERTYSEHRLSSASAT